ncbi:Sterile alpha motif domain-containing protein [Gryllus bimaculatus]|nr:Sterile alpha motif domain-containing protein [Gryllus bimaculatus]
MTYPVNWSKNLIRIQTGERGYLEGLASRYADLYRTHYGDVLDHLEELRRREWAEMSPRMRGAGLTSSQSQPLYVPGKYSPSSCLSDKEEDEIYGFGYGVFGRHIAQAQRRAQQAQLLQQAQTASAAGGGRLPRMALPTFSLSPSSLPVKSLFLVRLAATPRVNRGRLRHSPEPSADPAPCSESRCLPSDPSPSPFALRPRVRAL